MLDSGLRLPYLTDFEVRAATQFMACRRVNVPFEPFPLICASFRLPASCPRVSLMVVFFPQVRSDDRTHAKFNQQRYPSTHANEINRTTNGALRESPSAIHFAAVNLHSQAVRRLSVDALFVLSRTLQRATRGYRQRAAPANSRAKAPSA